MARILIIDDDARVRRILSGGFERLGHEVQEAVDGADGIHAFLHTRFDLVVTDVFMGDRRGTETVRWLRRLDPTVPIIAVPGPLLEDLAAPLDDAERLGADVTMRTVFGIADITAAAARLLADERRRRSRELAG